MANNGLAFSGNSGRTLKASEWSTCFAFLLALLSATATIIGIIVLRQIPSAVGVLGVVLVMIRVAAHEPASMPAPDEELSR